MAVNGINKVPGVSGVYNKQGVSKVEKGKEVQGKKDELSISNAGQDFNAVMKALKEVPDVRQDRVNQLSQQVETDSYSKSSEEVADKLMENFLGKKV